MKNLFTLAALLGLTLMSASAQTSRVRVVHASADAPAVDILVDGNVAFEGLKFRDYTNYTPVPSGMRMIAINVAGTTTTALRLPFTLASGVDYTFYAFGKLGNFTLTIIGTGDDLEAPAMNSTKVRVVHGASTAPAVDIYVTAPFAALPNAPLLTGVPFTAASHYLTVPAGDYQARVAVAGTKTVAIDSRRLRLAGGTVRTVVALDGPDGGPFELLVLNDVN
jgi:hypothetical protein